jgi:DNA-directed RNA polymerase specialized sigma24 family protein
MFDLEGRPVQQIASALQRSEGAVYMLRARAHDRLREILGFSGV